MRLNLRWLAPALSVAALLWPTTAAAAHDLGGPAPFNPDHACLAKTAVTEIIELSSVSNVAVADLWDRMRFAGLCRYFAHGLGFWPDEDAVVAAMQWGPAHRSQVMYVLRGHEAHGMPVYIWVTAAQARKLNIRFAGG